MNNQVDGAPEIKLAKPDGAAVKQNATAATAKKEKPPKEKLPKTSYTGRVEEVTISADGSVALSLKDKRGKSHGFTLGAVLGANAAAIQLLSVALTGKMKVHLWSSTDKPTLVTSLSLHNKK